MHQVYGLDVLRQWAGCVGHRIGHVCMRQWAERIRHMDLMCVRQWAGYIEQMDWMCEQWAGRIGCVDWTCGAVGWVYQACGLDV